MPFHLLFLPIMLATPPAVDSNPPGWSMVEPGGETTCALGSPFRFFVHEGSDSASLLVYFEGGGACWDWVSCQGMFDTSVDRDELEGFAGIFDFAEPRNPFRDFTMVFVPYCTGDLHVGDTVTSYADGSQPVAHHGRQNVDAVVSWLAARRLQPTRVVVAGASAGSYAALFYAPRVARMYPRARTVMIGDSGIPLLNGYPPILEQWGVRRTLGEAWQGAPPPGKPITLPSAYAALAAVDPPVTAALLQSDRDAIQSAFYLVSGSPEARPRTYALIDSLRAASSRFHAFVVAGADHGLMRTKEFYRYEADGTLLRDWIAALVAGRPVADVRCGACHPD